MTLTDFLNQQNYFSDGASVEAQAHLRNSLLLLTCLIIELKMITFVRCSKGGGGISHYLITFFVKHISE
jgi:hypothetical protein